MGDRLLIFYSLVVVGLLDFIVMPRFLIFSWKKRENTPPFASKLILFLRISGFIFILLAFLLRFTNFF